MAKKRKSEASRLDEVERSMYSTFCIAANSLSQIYTQAMSQQKLSFHAGERHALEKLYQWILRQHEETSRVTAADIVAYLQHEIDYGGDDASMSPRNQAPPIMNGTNSIMQISSGFRTAHVDQTKNSVFSNALSNPICRTLQSCSYYPYGANGSRNNEANSSNLNKDPNSNENSSMDMH